MPERITLTTSDGVEIIGNLYRSRMTQRPSFAHTELRTGRLNDSATFAIFLHMMPQTKEGWDALATRLQTEYQVTGLAIDERGHGESTMAGALDYKRFSDAEQQAKILDVEAAFAYLKTLGAREENTIVVGGSIGANLAIQFLTRHPAMRKAVALSPGLDYRGILAKEEMLKLHESQQVLIVSSDDDPESNHEVADILVNARPNAAVLMKLTGAGHAERMLNKQVDLVGRVIGWIIE